MYIYLNILSIINYYKINRKNILMNINIDNKEGIR